MIRKYEFGKIQVNDTLYDYDILLYKDKVKSWWRLEGHRVAPVDLDWLIKQTPKRIVIGTGYSGVMEVPLETVEHLSNHNIDVLSAPSKDAVKKFNGFLEEGKDVALAIHLTC